mmetsp:Transcript_52427/g.122317  ORF Transcript_52427/g.122317 Transcript_52427/m.122317 type:complete len:113 (-) Transcript_52427:55-393(-)
MGLAPAMMTDPFSIARRVAGTVDQTVGETPLPNCAAAEEDYVCGPKVVPWWPAPWANWLMGGAIMLAFAVLACGFLPEMERSFHERQAAAANQGVDLPEASSFRAAGNPYTA